MNDDKQDDAATQDSSRKRPPPTIDLTATSVSDGGAPNDTGASASSSASPKMRKSWRDRLRAARVAITPSFRRPSSPKTGIPRPARAALTSVVAAGLIGAVIASLVFGGWWLADSSTGPDRILSRMPTSTAKSDNETTGKRAAKADASALTTRLDALEKSVASLREEVSSARASIDEVKAAIPPAVDTGAIDERISKIERATVALTAEIATSQKPGGDDRRLRRIAIAATLDAAVNKGDPYAVALSAAKSGAENATVLTPLDQFADKGLPSAASLNRELLTLLPQATPKPAAPAQTAGLLDRLQQSALKLVRVRRVDDDESAAVIARAKAAAQRGDLAAARREVEPLSGSARAPLASWIEKVDAREAAIAASRQFASGAVSAPPSPAQ